MPAGMQVCQQVCQQVCRYAGMPLHLCPVWLQAPVPRDPHFGRSEVRITDAAHWEASGRATHPCSWCSASELCSTLESPEEL